MPIDKVVMRKPFAWELAFGCVVDDALEKGATVAHLHYLVDLGAQAYALDNPPQGDGPKGPKKGKPNAHR